MGPSPWPPGVRPACLTRGANIAREASAFYVANTRFWEAALLPIAVVVVVAFSSCMDLCIGRFVSLSWWYAANLYAMSYAFQALHPQIPVHPLAHCSPFGGAGALCLWSAGISGLEMAVYYGFDRPKTAQAVGTTLYGICGCFWLHAVLVPWRVVPDLWRRGAPTRSSGTWAGHIALAVAGYALFVSWRCAATSGALTRPTRLPPAAGPVQRGAARSRSARAELRAGRPQERRPRGWAALAQPAASTTSETGTSATVATTAVATEPPLRSGRGAEMEALPLAITAALPPFTVGLPAAAGPPVAVGPPVAAGPAASTLPAARAPATARAPPPSEGRPALRAVAWGALAAPLSTLGGQESEAAAAPGSVGSQERLMPGPNMRPGGNASSQPQTPLLSQQPKEVIAEMAMSVERPRLTPTLVVLANQSLESRNTSSADDRGLRELATPVGSNSSSFYHGAKGPGQRLVPQPMPAATEVLPAAVETVSAAHLAAHEWGRVLLVGAAALSLLWVADRGKSFEFSVPYLIVYNVLFLRVPDLLGHTVISCFEDTHRYTSPALATTAISFAYMASMQVYLILLRWVCRNMSSQHLFPRFHFVAQMYYYLFWYMMLMVISPGGVQDWSFWVMVAMLNGNYLVSNVGVLQHLYAALRYRSAPVEPPLKTLFDAKLAVQDQLADVVSLLIVPAIATSFHICTAFSITEYPGHALISLWQRFGALLAARLVSGLLTEEIFRRRLDLLYRADAMELQLLPLEASQNRLRYLNDICIGPKLAMESMKNIERCELYFAAVAVACTFAVFQRGDVPARYAFIAFGV